MSPIFVVTLRDVVGLVLVVTFLLVAGVAIAWDKVDDWRRRRALRQRGLH